MVGIVEAPVNSAAIAKAQRPSLNNYGPGNPLYIAHRNAALRFPEETIAGMDAALASGLVTLEHDCQLLTDGSLGIMHDDTAGRTCTTNPTITTLSTPQFKDLVMASDTWFGGAYGNLNPPLFEEVIARYNGKALLFPEAKSLGSGPALVAILDRYQVAKDQVLVQSFNLSDLTPAIAAGYQTLLATSGTSQVSAAKSAGVKWVTLGASATQVDVNAWHAAGIKATIYTIDRRWQRDKFNAMGVDGFFTNDPEYLMSNAPASNVDTFASQKWPRGMVARFGDVSVPAERGKLYTGGYWGFDVDGNSAYVLQGWACPIKNTSAPSFSLYLDLTFVAASGGDATRWAGVWFPSSSMGDDYYDDSAAANEFGYNILLRKDGRLQIFRRDAGVNTTLITSGTQIAIADGAEVRYRIDFSATAIAVNRLNADSSVNYSATANDATYRGSYFHIGKNGLGCKFRNLRIV